MKRYTPRQFNTRHPLKAGLRCWVITVAAVLFITACTRTASTSPTNIATDSAALVTVNQVQVTQGTGIYISGTSSIPEGGCVQTELLADGQPVDWWPKDICIEVGEGRWEMLVGLGRDGAPEQLESSVAYEIHAWWPDQPETSSTRFPFDLEGPPQP